MPDTPLRGRRGRDRRIAERVATDFAARHAPPRPETETDFDIAAVDAEVADARRRDAEALAAALDGRRRGRRRGPRNRAQGATPTGTARQALPRPPWREGPATARAAASASPTCRRFPRCSPRRGRSRASVNDLHRRRRRRRGRHVGLVAIPHGAKSYLAAALAQGRDGERLAWIARDAEIGDRVAEELGCVARRPRRRGRARATDGTRLRAE